MKNEQAFFRADEWREAAKAADDGWLCYEVIDRRSKKPKPLMFIVGEANMLQFKRAGMMKRMWIVSSLNV